MKPARMILTTSQMAAAEALLQIRPPVTPNTRDIIDERQAGEWNAKVMAEMHRTSIQTMEQTAAFCDVAGLAK